MIDVPEMPKDWWPAGGVTVVAKDGNAELGFAILQTHLDGHPIEQTIRANIEALRFALWQEKHAPSGGLYVLPKGQSFRDIKDEING